MHVHTDTLMRANISDARSHFLAHYLSRHLTALSSLVLADMIFFVLQTSMEQEDALRAKRGVLT